MLSLIVERFIFAFLLLHLLFLELFSFDFLTSRIPIALAYKVFKLEYIRVGFKAVFMLNPKIILIFLIRSNFKETCSFLKCIELL